MLSFERLFYFGEVIDEFICFLLQQQIRFRRALAAANQHANQPACMTENVQILRSDF